VNTQEDELRAELKRAALAIGAPDDFDPVIERPRDPAFGDWATSSAMVLARPLKKKPRDIAEALLREIDKKRAGLSAAEIAGPGFINFRVATDTIARGLSALVAAGERFGKSTTGAGKPVNVEFVSANPPDRSTSAMAGRRRWATRSRRSWNDRMEGHARVLLQRRRRADESLALSVQARVRRV